MLKKHRDGKLWVISGVTEYRRRNCRVERFLPRRTTKKMLLMTTYVVRNVSFTAPA